MGVRLDPAQRGVIDLPVGQAILILGEAGHGKTTVALHRLAAIGSALTSSRDARSRAAVIVPSEGLARLIQPLLRRLGVDVEARTYDAWARSQARRAFPDLPRRESEITPPSVQRLKRDPALRVALAELASREPGRIDDDYDDGPSPASQGLVCRGDLQHLFGDRLLLETVKRQSRMTRTFDVAQVLDHNRVAFGLTAEEEYAHVFDRRRLKAVDGRRIDEGTGNANAGRVDVEDYAVLFELDRLRASRLGRAATPPRLYDVVLVDEAQEFAPLELALIGRSLAPGGTMIVAGDADQHMAESADFPGWDGVMLELGIANQVTVRLEVGYRCPPPVAELAHHVLDPIASSQLAAGSSRGRADVLCFESEGALVDCLGPALRRLRLTDPRASVAVLCKSPQTAGRMARSLKEHVALRLVYDGRFLPRGAVQVTMVDEVKGLEFDYVIVPDATEADYPESPAARRALYVAVTRARFQVVVACVGTCSPILPNATSGRPEPRPTPR